MFFSTNSRLYAVFLATKNSSWVAWLIARMSDIDSTLAYNESVEDSIRFGQVDVLDENDGV